MYQLNIIDFKNPNWKGADQLANSPRVKSTLVVRQGPEPATSRFQVQRPYHSDFLLEIEVTFSVS